MFFMSYIVATCILMGATIDYGILMSTNYLHNREHLDKKEALYRAVEAAMPTVFTSGLILTICGLIIGFISSQSAISTVGILLGKGTLVSILMITLVLPSVLYLLDGFILKFSIKKKSK
jgi:predicted RND superfamily exporter protein